MADKITIEIELDDKKAVKTVRQFKKKAGKAASDAGDGIGREISQGIGRSLATAGIGIIAALGIREIAQANIEFGKSLAEIRTISQGLGFDQKELRKQLLLTSAEFGTSAAQQAQAFYQVISAGITDATKANETLVAANKLAIGGLTSTAEAIDIITSAVNAFQGQNLSATRAADILFGTVRLGKTRVDELASSLGQVLPTAAALGVSFEDVSAGLAQLTTRGVSTSEAVTQLNAILTAVLKKQDQAKKLGPEVAKAFSLQALQVKGLTVFLRDLNDALGGSEQKLVKLTGRAEAARAIITFAADGFKGLEKNVIALANSTGAADAAFLEITQTLDFKLSAAAAKTQGVFLALQGESKALGAGLDFLNKQLDDILLGFELFGTIDDIIGATVTSVLLSLNKLALGAAELSQGPLAILFPAFAIAASIAIPILKENIESLEQSLVNVAGQAIKTNKAFQESFAPETFIKPLKEAAKEGVKAARAIDKAFQASLRTGISQSVQALGAALVGAEGGFKKFGQTVLGIIGDMAINLGTTLIAMGIGIDALKASLLTFGGAAAIVAGVALVLIGGALKSLASGSIAEPVGGGGVTSPAGGGAVATPGEIFTPEDEIEPERRRTEVTINVEGIAGIGDKRELAQALAEIIKDGISTNDIGLAVV